MSDAAFIAPPGAAFFIKRAAEKPLLRISTPIINGNGYLAGTFPDGITTVEGVPVSATVLLLLRSGHGRGIVVRQTRSAPDGTWRVEGLDPNLKYDVVGRKDGFNDVIMANVTPVTD